MYAAAARSLPVVLGGSGSAGNPTLDGPGGVGECVPEASYNLMGI